MKETSKCQKMRGMAGHFFNYLKGKGIDIGCGDDKLQIESGTVDSWDICDGDAMLMKDVKDCTYDFVYSSHCLEHLKDVELALKNWARILKPGGFLYFTVPDFVLYEKMLFPSKFNGDHKNTFSCYFKREKVNNRKTHYHYDDIDRIFKKIGLQTIDRQLEDYGFNYDLGPSVDQTLKKAVCQLLFIAKKI